MNKTNTMNIWPASRLDGTFQKSKSKLFIKFPRGNTRVKVMFSSRNTYWSQFSQRYYIGFSEYPTVLMASDFYYIFLYCGIALKIELRCKFTPEICNLKWIRWTIHSTPTTRASFLTLSHLSLKAFEVLFFLVN